MGLRYPYVRPSICPQKVFPIPMKFGMLVEVDEWCTTVCRMNRFKVKVTRPLKLEILRFSKSISSTIFNVNWQMTTDSETTEQYLTFVRSRFLICPSFCVTWLRTRKGLRAVCTCLCYYNTIRQVAAAFWGGDPQFHTGLIFKNYNYFTLPWPRVGSGSCGFLLE